MALELPRGFWDGVIRGPLRALLDWGYGSDPSRDYRSLARDWEGHPVDADANVEWRISSQNLVRKRPHEKSANHALSHQKMRGKKQYPTRQNAPSCADTDSPENSETLRTPPCMPRLARHEHHMLTTQIPTPRESLSLDDSASFQPPTPNPQPHPAPPILSFHSHPAAPVLGWNGSPCTQAGDRPPLPKLLGVSLHGPRCRETSPMPGAPPDHLPSTGGGVRLSARGERDPAGD